MDEKKPTQGKVIDFLGRHISALIIAFLVIAGIIYLQAQRINVVTQLNGIYGQMQNMEDSVAAAVQEEYLGDSIPPKLIDAQISQERLFLKETPKYQGLQNLAQKLEAGDNINSPWSILFLWILGVIVSGILTGLILYVMTEIKFTKIIVKGGDDDWSEEETSQTLKGIFKLYCFILLCYTILMTIWIYKL